MSELEQQELLRVLEARGQEFLSAFGPSFVGSSRDCSSSREGKRRRLNDKRSNVEEWSGFGHSSDDDDSDDHGAEEVTSEQENGQHPNVVIFSEQQFSSGSAAASMSKAQMKAFMSSKVSKLRQDVSEDQEKEGDTDSDQDDLTNAQNDALLHRLVHTRLLSGSLDPELDLSSAQRKKALAGRVLEAAGKAKLGKGERVVRSAERNKAAKHVREGIAEKQKERRKKELEEAKHLGNYHPTLKRLYDADEKHLVRKREKGLAMGVGSFSGGTLKLRKDVLQSVRESGGRGRGGGARKRGGKRR